MTNKNLSLLSAGPFVSPVRRPFNYSQCIGTIGPYEVVRGLSRGAQTFEAPQKLCGFAYCGELNIPCIKQIRFD